jgi:hypothetical protein
MELEKSSEQVMPGREGVGERVETGEGGRNDPNNVCTCELMNKKKKKKTNKTKKIVTIFSWFNH